jgi:hypothetical protein
MVFGRAHNGLSRHILQTFANGKSMAGIDG